MKKQLLTIFFLLPLLISSQTVELVRHSYPGSGSYSKGTFRNLTAVGNILFFVTDDGINGSELFKSDGTEAGTVLVKDIYPGGGSSKSSKPRDLIAFQNQLLFFAYTGETHGNSLWKSDGTESGTVKVKSVSEGSGSNAPTIKIVIGNTLYFAGIERNSGYGLWKTDGTETGTVLVKAINPTGTINLKNFVEFKNKLYFSADINSTGNELWVSDGTESGTVMVKDIMPGGNTSHSNIGGMTVVGNELFFVADDGTHGSELWKTDGTEAGTVLVKDIMPGSTSSSMGNLVNANGVLFFRASDSNANGKELWKSDGTEAGTVMVKDIRPGVIRWSTHSKPTDLRVIGNNVYFIADDGNHGTELWKSDGTEAGTIMIKDIDVVQYSGGASGNSMVVFNNHIIFKGTDTNGQEPWISDGTDLGTYMLKDTNEKTTTYATYFETKLYIGRGTITDNGVFFFLSFDGVNGTEPSLWKLDKRTLSVENETINDLVKMNVYPNPSSDIIKLKVNNQQIKLVKVYSLMGKEVMRKVHKKHSVLSLDISLLSAGIYFVKVSTDTNTFTKRIIKR